MKRLLLLTALSVLVVSCRTVGGGYCREHTRPYDLIGYRFEGGNIERYWQCWDAKGAWGGGSCHYWTTNKLK